MAFSAPEPGDARRAADADLTDSDPPTTPPASAEPPRKPLLAALGAGDAAVAAVARAFADAVEAATSTQRTVQRRVADLPAELEGLRGRFSGEELRRALDVVPGAGGARVRRVRRARRGGVGAPARGGEGGEGRAGGPAVHGPRRGHDRRRERPAADAVEDAGTAAAGAVEDAGGETATVTRAATPGGRAPRRQAEAPPAGPASG